MFWLYVLRNDIPEKGGMGKAVKSTNRPSGLRGFHSTGHEISNTPLSAGRSLHAHTHTHTHTQAALGLILHLVGIHQQAHVDPAEYQNIFGRDFSGQELTAAEPKRAQIKTLPPK